MIDLFILIFVVYTAGLFSAFGIPLMGLAMGNITSLHINFGNPVHAKQVIRQQVTAAEIEMMGKFGFENGDDMIDESEYTLLCCLRLGAMNPALVHEINKRFDKLNTSSTGILSETELLQAGRRRNVISINNNIPLV